MNEGPVVRADFFVGNKNVDYEVESEAASSAFA